MLDPLNSPGLLVRVSQKIRWSVKGRPKTVTSSDLWFKWSKFGLRGKIPGKEAWLRDVFQGVG